MAETFIQFQTPVAAPDGTLYRAKACGGPMDDGLWQAWLEFTPFDGRRVVRSGRETTQPNRVDTVYWATGLSRVYLEGALRRALEGPFRPAVAAIEPPAFDGPEPSIASASAATESTAHAVLDPFVAFRKGEALLRKQLSALAAWHLVNIVVDFELNDAPITRLNRLSHAALVEMIVSSVREQLNADRDRANRRTGVRTSPVTRRRAEHRGGQRAALSSTTRSSP